MRAVVIGECMVELARRPDGAYRRGFAGDAYNTAVHLKTCRPGTLVQFVSATGQDETSAAMRAAWRANGVDEALSPALPGASPGLYLVDTDADGERRFSYRRGQSAARRWAEVVDWQRLAGADLAFFTGVSLAILPPGARAEALRKLAGLGPTRIAFDPNLRPSLWEDAGAMIEACRAAIALVDVVLPSADDARRLFGHGEAEDWARKFLDLGPSEVAITLGGEGALVAGRGVPASRICAPAAVIVDTSGARDAFNGAYLAARLDGAPQDVAAAAGLALAAKVVARPGALPNLDEEGP